MNPIWRVTMEMSKSRLENQKLSKKRREMMKDKTRKEKEKRRVEALERDHQRFVVGQEQSQEEFERDEPIEEVQESAAEKFQKELCWCIQQTQLGLASIKPASKEAKSQAEEAQRLLRILTSAKAPMAKKRQVMRATFGDYRSKMQQEERKHKADMSKRMCLEPVSPSKQGSSTFYRMASIATAVPLSQALPASNDHPGSLTHGSSGDRLDQGWRLSGDDRLQAETADTSMEELEKGTEDMHIISRVQNETGKETVSNDNASQCSQAKQTATEVESGGGKHSKPTGPITPQVESAKRSGLALNLNQESRPFSFNFDIRERDVDRGDSSRWKGSNRNVDGSLSENSTPEKGPGSGGGGGRKKASSRRRNRGHKKKQLSLIRDKEAAVTGNIQATVSDNQVAIADNQSTVIDNQKLQLEADREFKFDFPDPVEQAVVP